jgi:hypothetical protein
MKTQFGPVDGDRTEIVMIERSALMRSLKLLLPVFGLVLGLISTVLLAVFSDSTSRSSYAFAGESTSSAGLSFSENPLLFVVVVPLLCAVLGWLTALVLTKRGWVMSRSR